MNLKNVTEDQTGDGYTWNAAEKVLTLNAATIIGDVTLPTDSKIVVSTDSTIEGSLYLSSADSATVISGGMLYVNGVYGIALDDSAVTLNLTIDGAEVYAKTMSGTHGKLSLKNYAYLNMNSLSWTADAGVTLENSQMAIVGMKDDGGGIFVKNISLDHQSKIYVAATVSGYSSGNLKDLEQGFLPEGYTVGKESEGSSDISVLDEKGTQAMNFSIYYRTTEATVTFDLNYDGVTEDPTTQTTEDNKLSSLPTPEREGYSFDGWYTEKTGGEQVTTDTVFEEDTTVYAHWTEEAAATGEEDSDDTTGTTASNAQKVIASDDEETATGDEVQLALAVMGLALAGLAVAGAVCARKKQRISAYRAINILH